MPRSALSVAAFPRWTPLSLTSLLAWWSADAGVTLTSGAVSSWKDVKAALDAAQGTGANRPLLGAFGGGPLASITFDGTDDELTVASCPLPSVAVPSEVHSLVNQAALVGDTGTRMAFSYGGTANATRRAALRRVVSAANRFGADTGDNSVAIATNDTAVDFSGRRYGRVVFGAAATAVQADAQAATSGNVVPATGTTRIRIGANTANTAANFWSGGVRHIVVTGLLGAHEAALLRRWMLDQTGATR